MLGQAGDQLVEKQLWRVGLEDPGGHQVEHEIAMYPGSKEDQQHPGLHWKECCQQVEEGDSSPLLFTGETHLEGPI